MAVAKAPTTIAESGHPLSIAIFIRSPEEKVLTRGVGVPILLWLAAMPLGEACGVCLELVTSSECPSETEIAVLPTCDATHAQGDLCEGDGECGTARTANNVSN